MPGAGVRRQLAVVAICMAVVLSTAYAVHAAGRSVRRSERAAIPTAYVAPSSQTGPSPTGPRAAADSSPAPGAGDLAKLLSSRANAILAGDRTAWLATVASGGGEESKRFRTEQVRLFDRVTRLRPAAWGYRFLTATPLERQTDVTERAFLADVELSYRITRAAPRVHRQQFLSVIRRGDRWLVAADTGGPTDRDVWDLAPVVRADSARCVVIGTSDVAALVRGLAAECDRSADTVDDIWGTAWARRTVLTVPGSLSQLAVLLGRDGTSSAPSGLERTAALTVGPAAGPADEVLVNGEAFDKLSRLGRRVVLTHELVHVATRSTGSRSAPTWLSEGFADHVAYAGTGLTPEQVAGEALAAVRAGRLPAALPSATDFDAAGPQAAVAYGGAWVAVEVIADRVRGPAGLRDFYRLAGAAPVPGTIDGDANLQAALAFAHLADISQLVDAWQARLVDLAS